MTEIVPNGKRLDWFMNQRRLDLGLRWEEVADGIGISESGLRTLRREGSVPRDLTQRGIERALHWERGSVARILAGGDPTVAQADAPSADAGATVAILRGALSAGEQYILDSDLPADFAAELVRAWREHGIDELIRLYAERQRRTRNG